MRPAPAVPSGSAVTVSPGFTSIRSAGARCRPSTCSAAGGRATATVSSPVTVPPATPTTTGSREIGPATRPSIRSRTAARGPPSGLHRGGDRAGAGLDGDAAGGLGHRSRQPCGLPQLSDGRGQAGGGQGREPVRPGQLPDLVGVGGEGRVALPAVDADRVRDRQDRGGDRRDGLGLPGLQRVEHRGQQGRGGVGGQRAQAAEPRQQHDRGQCRPGRRGRHDRQGHRAMGVAQGRRDRSPGTAEWYAEAHRGGHIRGA